jgi:predicted phage-related endonuclease
MSDRRDKCIAAIERRRQMGDLRAAEQFELELARIDAEEAEVVEEAAGVLDDLLKSEGGPAEEEAVTAAEAFLAEQAGTPPAIRTVAILGDKTGVYRTKHYATEAEWKADHRFMSGSRVAKVVGLSQWGGPLTAYLECTDPQDIEVNPAMEAGNRLETAVAEWAADVHGLGECKMNGRSVVIHPEHDFIRATADAWTDKGGLEIKTSNHKGWPGDANGPVMEFEPEVDPGLPSDVWCQVLLTMAITGAPHWYVAVLSWGRDLRAYKVPASPKCQAWLIAECVTFWNEHVEPRRAPAPTEADGSPGDSGLLTQRLYPSEEKGSVLDVNDDVTATWARAWVEASKLEAKAKVAKELAALQMTQHMAEHETMYVRGNKYTWKTNKWGNRSFRGPSDWKHKEQD